MNLIYYLVFNFCIESLCSLVLKRVLISEKVRCTLSALKIWIYSCRWINCKLTFQFKFSRGTETISWILHFVLSHRLSLLLCLKLNYRILGFFCLFYVVFLWPYSDDKSGVCTGLYFLFSQGEDCLSNLH